MAKAKAKTATKKPTKKPAKRPTKAAKPKRKPAKPSRKPPGLDRAARTKLDAARELVVKSPKRAFFAARELATKLGPTAEAVLVLDTIADDCLARDARYAREAFSAARAIDRKRGIATPLARYRALAVKGALDPRELTALLASASGPHRDLAELAIETVAAGQSPDAELVAAIAAVDRELLATVMRGWLERTELDDVEVWLAAQAVLPELVRDDAAVQARVLDIAGRARDPETGLALIVAAKLADAVAGDASTRLAEQVIRIVNADATPESLAKLGELLATLTLATPVSVIPKPERDGEAATESWNRQLVDAAIVEQLLARGIPIRIPRGDPETYTFWLGPWSGRDGEHDRLDRVAAHSFFGRVLVASLMPHEQNAGQVESWLARAATRPQVLELLEERVLQLVSESCSLGALEVWADWIEALCQPDILGRSPAIGDAIRALDPARLLRNQLRAGMMDEWGWPARDAALDRLGGPSTLARSGPFPYEVLSDGRRMIAIDADGIVFDQPYPHAKPRQAYYAGGDVLVCPWGAEPARWLVAGGSFAADGYGFFDLAAGGGIVLHAGTIVRPGQPFVRRADGRGAGRRAWFDGATYYDVAQEVMLFADGTPADRRSHAAAPIETFDPETGARTGTAIPPWMASLLGPGERLIVDIQGSFIQAVPARAVDSPLGARDGLGGFAIHTREGEVIAQGIDGRRAPGLVGGEYVVALMTFPERSGFYPVVQRSFDLGICQPDGTPLVSIGALERGGYWGGTQALDLMRWHLLEPRDREASRSLAACSDAAARAIYAAAVPAPVERARVIDHGTMQAVLVPAAAPATSTPALEAAIRAALPAVTHPRMLAGIAALAGVAVRLAPAIERIHGKLRRAPGPRSALANGDAKALARILDHQMHWWIEKLGTQLGEQMHDVAQFLFSDAAGPVTPARTVMPWDALITRIGELLYRVVARGTPSTARAELVAVLEVWVAAGYPEHASRLRTVELAFPAGALSGLDHEHPDRLVVPGNRYFMRWSGARDQRELVRAIEYAPDGVFRVPDGAELVSATPADARFTSSAIREVLALARDRGPVPFAPEIAERIACATGLGASAATLVWAAGYDPWLASARARATLAVDDAQLELAEVELRGKRLRELYARAMPERPEQIYEPTAADRLAAVYVELFGATAPLPTELLTALRADLRDDSLPLERDARILVDPPGEAAVLTRDETWVIRPFPPLDAGARHFRGFLPAGWPQPASGAAPDRDNAFHGYAVSRFARYVAWAHLALPGDHPAHRGAARIGTLLRERLANPELLVLAGIVDLSPLDESSSQIAGRALGIPDLTSVRGFSDTLARFPGSPYRAADGGASAEARDRGELVVAWPAERHNGLFFAVRPARLDDTARTRLLAELGIESSSGATPTQLRFGELPIIAPASFGHWVTWSAPGFQRLVDALGVPFTGYAADPRISAPAAVAEVRSRFALDEAAGCLYLQRRALPDASATRITRYNGWSSAEHAAAAATLAKRGLAPELVRSLYGLDPEDAPVFGVVLPLRPLGEIFADAARA